MRYLEQMSQKKTDINSNFQELILHRVHEILLVASPYDAFTLEEDGQLTEQILHEYMGMNLSYAPRVWRASTAADAMKMISKRKFDLIIVMIRISDMDPISLSKKIKSKNSKIPVVLLVFDESELKQLTNPIPKSIIDRVFTWSGNANVFPAIIKFIEDRLNIKRDVKKGGVRVIILVEDSPRYYSIILPLLYKEITFHTRNLISKSIDDAQRQLHMRGRPKILLASTWEEAEKYYNAYRENLFGIISDIRFPKKRKLIDNCGIDFIELVRLKDPSMPILLQSTDINHQNKAKKINIQFIHKKSPTLLQDLKEFIMKNFGFGDFEFQTPKGDTITKCSNIYELRETVKTVSIKSLRYHASRNHFSNWLAARGEFDLANIMRPILFSDFNKPQDMREHLLVLLGQALKKQQAGKVVEFSPDSFNPETTYVRISDGSLGGKARGLAYANQLINQSQLDEEFKSVNIRIPKIAVIGTDEFDLFMESNKLWQFALNEKNNITIENKFLKARLSRNLIKKLKSYLSNINYPIAIRSSSLLEDSQYQPLAGLYATYMLPNNAKNLKTRLSQLCEAIKRVYSSTFFQDPKSVMHTSSSRQEEEKMGILIQELVGRRYKNIFYPTFSGVSQSLNYYPVSYLKREQGIAFVAIGFGKTIVEGEKSLRFCPAYPNILPQYYSIKSTIENTQNHFYALKMDSKKNLLQYGEQLNLKKYNLNQAEKNGVLKYVASVISNQDGIVRDSLRYEGKRVITFKPILNWEIFPLTKILTKILELGKKALGCDVEIEFSVNLYDQKNKLPEFCLLQIRPMLINGLNTKNDKKMFLNNELVSKSNVTLGDGKIDNIKNILFIHPNNFDPSQTTKIAEEIGRINNKIKDDSNYLLIGPGRWGSTDPWLGVPVNWKQISKAKVIIEYSTEDFNIDPSFGSHFFQNVISLRIGYFTINKNTNDEFIDWEWLEEKPIKKQTKFVKWIELDKPLFIQLDGMTGSGIIMKPQTKNKELMNENQSTGI